MTILLLILIVILLGGGWILLLPIRVGLRALGLSVFGQQVIDFVIRNGEVLGTLLLLVTGFLLVSAVFLGFKIVRDEHDANEYWRLRGGLKERFTHVPCPYCGKKKMNAAFVCPSCNRKAEVSPQPAYWIFHTPM